MARSADALPASTAMTLAGQLRSLRQGLLCDMRAVVRSEISRTGRCGRGRRGRGAQCRRRQWWASERLRRQEQSLRHRGAVQICRLRSEHSLAGGFLVSLLAQWRRRASDAASLEVAAMRRAVEYADRRAVGLAVRCWRVWRAVSSPPPLSMDVHAPPFTPSPPMGGVELSPRTLPRPCKLVLPGVGSKSSDRVWGSPRVFPRCALQLWWERAFKVAVHLCVRRWARSLGLRWGLESSEEWADRLGLWAPEEYASDDSGDFGVYDAMGRYGMFSELYGVPDKYRY